LPGGLAAVLVLASCALVGGACGGNFEAGLANAPSIERQNRPTRQHDVIANADDSCPRKAGAFDPVPGRTPPCVDTLDDAGAPRGDAGPSLDGALAGPSFK
jgi:hypothetical protein